MLRANGLDVRALLAGSGPPPAEEEVKDEDEEAAKEAPSDEERGDPKGVQQMTSMMLLRDPEKPAAEPTASPRWGQMLRANGLDVRALLTGSGPPPNEEEVESEYGEEEVETEEMVPEPKGVGHWDSMMLLKPPQDTNPEPLPSPRWGQILRDSGIDVQDPARDEPAEFKPIPQYNSRMLLREPTRPAQDNETEPQWKEMLEQDGIKLENPVAADCDDDRILPELRQILTHQRGSMVYEAIAGEPVPDCSRDEVQCVIYELRKYLEITIARNMINESALLNSRIDDLRRGLRESTQARDRTISIQQKIDVAEAQRDSQTQSYMSKRMLCESERNARLDDLDLRYQEALEELDRQWNSTQFHSKFNRPSITLINVRHRVLSQMNARDFEGASYLVGRMRALELQESEVAAERMALSYREAADRLRKKYEVEREQIMQQCSDKITALAAREKEALMPVQNRLAKLYTLRSDLEAARRSALRAAQTIRPRVRPHSLRQLPDVRVDAKLKLPPLSRTAGRSQAPTQTVPNDR
jgi:hypothetical protein